MTSRWAVALTVVLAACAQPGPAQDPPAAEAVSLPSGGAAPTTGEVPAAEVSMDPVLLARLDSTIESAIAAGASPGVALAIGRHGRLVRLRGYGVLEPEEGVAATPRSLYDLASLTKVVGTTTAVMLLVDEGLVSLDDRVIDHLPWWSAGDPRKARVTLRHLLVHRAGLPAYRRWFLEISGREAYRRAIGEVALESEPGTATVYSDIGLMTAALIVEEVSGRSLDVFLAERVFGPLGMDDTGFLPDVSEIARIAPTELDTLWRTGLVRGRVHDENADAFGGVAGHAGLFSTAADLAVFADLLLQGGALPPCRAAEPEGRPCPVDRATEVRLFAPRTVALFTRRAGAESSRALGWDTPSGRSSAGDVFSATSFGHTGFTGTSLWLDPERDLFVVLLTNRVHPTRDNTLHVPLRRAVHDLAAAAVLDVPARTRGGGSR